MSVPSLYLHVPFCRARCAYCAFSSTVSSEATMERYLAALDRELIAKGALKPRTVYIGGGTPTALPSRLLERLLRIVRERSDLSALEEWTVEMNPGTGSEETFGLLAAEGVTRISIGVQTFSPEGRTVLGRIHSPEDSNRAVRGAVKAARDAHAAGLFSVSLDLIFGWPGQTEESWRRDLETAVALEPDHVSAYSLSLEEGTPLARRVRAISKGEGRGSDRADLSEHGPTPWSRLPSVARAETGRKGRAPAPSPPADLFPGEEENGNLVMPPPEEVADRYLATIDFLESAGYPRYETSNFSRPGEECLHNVLCWEYCGYEGAGASACAFVDGERRENLRDLSRYLSAVEAGESPVEGRERLDGLSRWGERAMLGLRLSRGVDLESFAREEGLSFDQAFADVLPGLERDGYLERAAGRILLSRKALPVADSILAEFVASPPG